MRSLTVHVLRQFVDTERNFQAWRPLLFAIAYRMLGSVMEAEDILQDAYIRYCTAAPEQV